MSGAPDPKPTRTKRRERRGRDASVTRELHLKTDECCACGRSGVPLSAHHVLYGGSMRYRLDDPRNLLMLCQTTTNKEGESIPGCHVRFHDGEAVTRSRIGGAISRRPAIIAFVIEALGDGPGRDYLRRRYALPTEV